MRTIGIFLIAAVLFSCPLFAQDRAVDSQDRTTAERLEGIDDSRLPPVLPGEEVVTSTGKRMRVWSSSGPVPVASPPEPTDPGYRVPASGEVGVIIDKREPKSYRGKPPSSSVPRNSRSEGGNRSSQRAK